MSARERVEAATAKAGLRVIGLDKLDQLLAFQQAGFLAIAEEFDRRDDVDFEDAITAIREMVTLLDGPVSEEAQKAQDIGKDALQRLVGEAS